jgi:hypothetical protein
MISMREESSMQEFERLIDVLKKTWRRVSGTGCRQMKCCPGANARTGHGKRPRRIDVRRAVRQTGCCDFG